MHKRKIGFTIVELVVIIAIVAILAALLVPTFSSMIDNAKRIGDIQLVKNLNTSLKADYTEHATMYSAMKAVKASGYTEDKIKNISTSDKNFVAWDSMNDRFVLISKETNTYIFPIDPDNESGEIDNLYDYFVIYDDVPETQTYSIYLSKNATVAEANVTVGFDAGENYGVSKLKYDRNDADSARTVIIRTNSGTECTYNGYVALDGTGDTILHYGEAGLQTIICANTSFHEHGAATEVEIKMGHYVQESGSIVAVINASAGEGDVVVDLKSGSIQGTVKNTNENNSVTITSEKNVKTVNFEAKLDGGELTVNLASQPSYANTTDRNVTNDNSNAVSISGVGTEERPIPAYGAVGEENAECVSVAGYSIKVYTNCNAYEYTEITANTGSAQEETTQEETAYVENTYTVINNGDGTKETVKSHEHNWGDPKEWTWEGYTKATAVFECQDKDCNLTETVIVPPQTEENYITHDETKAATCTEPGEITYTATITHHGKEHISVNKENIPIDLNEHNWGEVTYTWAEDNSKCTATRVCKNSADHSETETVIAITNGSERTATFENEAFGTHTIKLYATFTTVFPNVDKYLYRVGNGNAVKLGSLFKVEEGTTVSDNKNVSVTVSQIAGNAALEPYTKNDSNWTQSTLKFSGTGPVTVTIKEGDGASGGGKEYTLNLEVISAINVTAYSELTDANCVLLNNITMSSSSKFSLSGNNTLYGNGFTFDVSNGSYSNKDNSSSYVVLLTNANLNNVSIVGAVYTTFPGQTNSDYNNANVLTYGNCKIENCYISNCASPVRVIEGNLEIINTTLKGGCFANLDWRGGNLTLENVTTINQADDNDTAGNKKIVGLGIVAYFEGSFSGKTLNIIGTLDQYNYISQNDQNGNTINNAYISSLFSTVFGSTYAAYQKTVDNVKWVNTGFISMNSDLINTGIYVNGTQLNSVGSNGIDGYKGMSVTLAGKSGYLYAPQNTMDKNVVPDYVTQGQYDTMPTVSFTYPTEGKKNYLNESDDSYCYYSSTESIIKIGYVNGGNFTFDPAICTVTKYEQNLIDMGIAADGISYSVTMGGIDYTGKMITFSGLGGEYELIYEFTDPYNYDETAQNKHNHSYSYIVKVKTVEATLNVKDTIFTFGTEKIASTITQITVNGETRNFAIPDSLPSGGHTFTYGGKTIYAPVVEMITSDGTTSHSGSWNALFPVFKGAVEITDHTDSGTGSDVVYGASITSKPSGLTVMGKETNYTGGATSAFLYSANASNAQDKTGAVSGVLYYYGPKNLTGSNTRDETSFTVMYKYTDNADREYYYFVRYHCPAQTKGGCFAPGTLITLADGTQKAIENVTASDQILAWDFFKGEYTAKEIALLVDHGTDEYNIVNMTFSDGTILRTIAEHGLFDYDLNKFIYVTADNCKEYIGHRFVKYADDGNYSIVTMTDAYVTTEETNAYSITSVGTSNAFASGLLTVAPPEDFYNWIEMDGTLHYDVEQFANDVETYGLYTYEDFADYVTYEQFVDWNGAYLKIAVEKGYFTFDYILELIETYKQWMQ